MARNLLNSVSYYVHLGELHAEDSFPLEHPSLYTHVSLYSHIDLCVGHESHI